MTDLIAQPVLTVEIEPAEQISLALENADAANLIEEHEQALDPHPQYSTDTDLTNHTTNSAVHIPAGGLTNAQIATNAAIAWSKLDKTGAAAIDVGAASILHEANEAIHVPISGIGNNQIATNAAIDWAKISKVGATEFLTDAAISPSSPVVGQRWRDTNDWLVWYWSGQYWLSEEIFSASVAGTTYTGTVNPNILLPNPNYNFFFIDWRFGGLFNNPISSTAYWNFSIQRVAAGTSGGVIAVSGSLNVADLTVSSGVWAGSRSETLALHQDTLALNVGYYRIGISIVGAPGSLAGSGLLRYRLAKR